MEMSDSPVTNTDTFPRAAYSPNEFAALFGKEQTWAYHQLYSGKVKVIEGFGRAMIPHSEVERLTAAASEYKHDA